MYKYKIKKGGVNYLIKTDQNIARFKYNPALFFLCEGNYKLEKCGLLTAFKQLKNHFSSLINNWRNINEFTK